MEDKHFHTITVGPRVNYEFAIRPTQINEITDHFYQWPFWAGVKRA